MLPDAYLDTMGRCFSHQPITKHDAKSLRTVIRENRQAARKLRKQGNYNEASWFDSETKNIQDALNMAIIR